jgi:drug/metabolite transporter (DMT)-like permease
MQLPHPGEIAALGTAFCWTVTSMSFEAAGKRVGSLAVNLIRLVMALGFLTVFSYFHRGVALPFDADTYAWIWLSLSALAGFLIGDLSLFRAFVVLGSRLSMLVMALVPPITALIGWLILGEILGLRDWLGMGLTVGGVAWVALERKKDDSGKRIDLPIKGLSLALLGAIGQAAGLVLSKYGMRDFDPFAATQIRVIAGLIGFTILFFFIGWWRKTFTALRNPQAMARISLGAFFGPFLGVSLSLVAVQNTQSGIAATIMAIVPVLIIPPAILINKEKISLRAIIGAMVAVAGVSMLFL